MKNINILLSLIGQYWQLSFSLSKKIKANASVSYALAVMLFLSGQLFQVLAFFLPLKVLILIGSESIPSYLQSFISLEEKNKFIVGLAVAALACYLFYALCDYSVSYLSKNISSKIRAKANKLSIYQNEEALSKDIVLRLIRSRATYVMVVSGFLLGLAIEWRLFTVLLIVLAIEIYVLSFKWSKYVEPQFVNLKERFERNRGLIFTIVSSINFFFGFCFLFFLVFIGQISNILLAIFLILLIRQIFQRVLLAINDGIFLYSSKDKIIAIFYSKESNTSNVDHHQKSFANLVEQQSLQKLFWNELNMAGAKFIWADINQPHTALYEVELNQKSTSNQLWLKVFAQNKQLDFGKELDYLFNISNIGLMQSSVSSSGYIGGLYYILFETPEASKIELTLFKKHKKSLFFNLWQLSPSSELQSKILRSFPTLTKRLNKAKLKQIELAAVDKTDTDNVRRVIESYDKIISILNNIPLSIVNKELGIHNPRITKKGLLLLINWHKISLEPVCSSVPIKELNQHVDYDELLVFLRERRNDCDNLTAKHLMFSGLVGELERQIQKRHFSIALTLLEPTLKCLAELNRISEHQEKAS